MPVCNCLGLVHWGGKTQSECVWHHTHWVQRRNLKSTVMFISLCFLTVDAMQLATSCFCCHPPWLHRSPWVRSQNKPLLPSIASGRGVCHQYKGFLLTGLGLHDPFPLTGLGLQDPFLLTGLYMTPPFWPFSAEMQWLLLVASCWTLHDPQLFPQSF